jgi:hypothetical protein
MKRTAEHEQRASEIALAVSQGISFTALAGKYGLTRERVRQIALKAGLHGEDWRKVAWERRRTAAETKRPEGILGSVWDSALAHGLSVKHDLILRADRGRCVLGVRTHYLLIQGYRCMISLVRVAWRHSRHSRIGYGRHWRGREKWDFYILVNAAPGYKHHIFVVPHHSVERMKGFLYPPLKKRDARRDGPPLGRPPGIDWWSYENAWHLLKKPSSGKAK